MSHTLDDLNPYHTLPTPIITAMSSKQLLFLGLLVCILVGKRNIVVAQSNNRLWDIGEPEISFNGFQLDLEYTLRDQVREDNIRIRLYRDDDCENFEIDRREEENRYISVDIVPDLNEGNGNGVRKVCTCSYQFCTYCTYDTLCVVSPLQMY